MKPLEALEGKSLSPARKAVVDNTFVAGALILVGFLVLTRLAFRGWIPHDEGTLGQAASRVLAGEVPHVDFHDTYSGLQAFAHAGVFQLTGESVRNLRIANIAIAAIAGISSFALVRRVQPVVVAASTCVATCLVGFAVYPASMPSWWNAALGLAAAYLILRWLDSRNQIVLVSAGLLIGLSFLVKSTGIYVGVAIATYLLMLASPTSSLQRLLAALGYGIVVAFGVLLTSAPSVQAFGLLLVPMLVVVAVGFRSRSTPLLADHRAVPLWAVVVFALSALVPVLLFVLPYVWSGNANALVSGWIRLPQLRFDDAAWDLSVALRPVLWLGALGGLIYLVHRQLNQRAALGALLAAIVGIAVFGWTRWWGLLVTLIVLAPLIVSAGVVGAGWRKAITREHLLCALSLTAFAFIQFPVSNRIYAIYLVPWVVTAVAVWLTGSNKTWALATVLLLTSSIVAVQLERGHLYVSTPLTNPVELVPLAVDRGGIDVAQRDRFYVDLVKHLAIHSGSAIYAGPDAPEVYFLSDTSNPTPVLFDFLADDWNYGNLDEIVSEGRLSAVVVNRSPTYSAELPQGLLDVVEDEYPDRTPFGWFDVYEDLGDDDD